MKKIERIKKYIDDFPMVQKEIESLSGILNDAMDDKIEELDITFRKVQVFEACLDSDGYDLPSYRDKIFSFAIGSPSRCDNGSETLSFKISNKLKFQIMVQILEERKEKLQRMAAYFQKRNIPIN